MWKESDHLQLDIPEYLWQATMIQDLLLDNQLPVRLTYPVNEKIK